MESDLQKLIKKIDYSLLGCLSQYFHTSTISSTVDVFEKYYTTNWTTQMANHIAQGRVVVQGIEKY